MTDDQLSRMLDAASARPLTESILDEWWVYHPDHPVWVGASVDERHKSPNYLPDVMGGGRSVTPRMYERLLCNDVCVTVDEQSEDSSAYPTAYTPVVWLRESPGDWWRVCSYQALYSLPEILAIAGRPPWPFTVEIQPVYGRGLANEGCVALRLGKIGHAKRGR